MAGHIDNRSIDHGGAMVELRVNDGRLDLDAYSPDATLEDLRAAVEAARSDPMLITAFCAGCGRCCYHEQLPLFGYDLIAMRERTGDADLGEYVVFPPAPSLAERSAAVEDLMRQHGFDRITATLLFEYNAADPITYRKSNSGSCAFLQNGFCTNYSRRAYTCSLYVCAMGDRLASLQERIVRQGVWHSYSVEGWIAESEIAHNPFASATSYRDVLIAGFDDDLSDALEKLFFFF